MPAPFLFTTNRSRQEPRREPLWRRLGEIPKGLRFGMIALVLLALACALLQIGIVAMAYADPAPGAVFGKTEFAQNTTAWLCQDHGKVLNWILDEAWVLIFPFMASIIGNFRSRVPANLMPYIDIAAGDVLSGLKQRAVAKANGAGTVAKETTTPTPPPNP